MSRDITERKQLEKEVRDSEDSDRDYFMSAEEAKVYGIVDEVIENITKKKK